MSRLTLTRRVLRALSRRKQKPELLEPNSSDAEQALVRTLLYFLIPAWTAAGVFDWLWHRQTDIEHTSGIEESLIHLLMFAEAGLPLYMGLLLEINAGVLLTMVGALAAHGVTALWDVHYAEDRREVTEREQHTHSFLEVLPFAAVAVAACLHWGQAQALAGAGSEKPRFRFRLKQKRLPGGYIGALTGAVAFCLILPYGNELWRCVKAAGEGHYDGRRREALTIMRGEQAGG